MMRESTPTDADLVAGLTELEERLNGPDGASARAEALMRLKACQERLGELRNVGLAQETYAASEALNVAINNAICVLLTPRKENGSWQRR